MPAKTTIKKSYQRDDAARRGHLDTARDSARLTKAHIQPPAEQDPNDELPVNYQSVGSRGISILAGRLLLAIYPPGGPFFVLTPSPALLYDTDADQEEVEQFQQQLFLYVKAATSEIESSTVGFNKEIRRWQRGFRAEKMAAFEQALVCGDTLERLHDDYRMQLFPLDSYVNKRDSTGAVIYHITKEKKDVAELRPDQFAMTGLPAEIYDHPEVDKRIHDLYNKVEWQYQTKTWMITQEINGHELNQSEETVSPYFSTAFEFTSGDYGRSFVEQNIGDLRSLDALELARLDLLGLAAKALWAKDAASLIKNKDLQQDPGSVVSGARVVNGVLQDMAPIAFANPRDYAILSAGVQDKRTDLSRAMLIESETTRQAERVTTVEIQRNVAEINAALGGIYTALADEQQIPLAARLIHQFNKDNKISINTRTGLPATEIRSLTGLAALQSDAEGQKLLTALQIIQSLGPEAISRVDMNVAVNILLRQIGVHHPALIKSPQRLAADQQIADQRALLLQGEQQAIETVGKVVENESAQQAA